MARLRKPSSAEQSIFILPTSTASSARTSPRKTLRESPSKRQLRYSTPEDNEESFLIPKAPAGESPVRKQRVLRPIGSNSRLLRKISDESLAATPDRKPRRGVEDRGSTNYLYSKTLAKSVARKQKSRIELRKPFEVEQETIVSAVDVEKSISREDREEVKRDDKENVADLEGEEEDDDDESIVDVRHRRRQPRPRHVVSDTEEESEEEEGMVRSDKDFAEDIGLAIEMPPPPTPMRAPFRKGHSSISNWASEVIDLTSSPDPSFPPPARARTASFAASSRPTSSASTDMGAVMHYSPTPTKFCSPRKAPPISRPSTPPPPPESPSRLVSPSKRKPQIPQAPDLRPSIDAFWNPEVVNDWNDKHSPSKPLISPRKQRLFKQLEAQVNAISLSDEDSDGSIPSPTTSPRKKKSQSPKKKTSSDSASPAVADVRAQRKDFAARKHAIADAFLAELDNAVTNGRIIELSKATGGIKLIWSKTLKTTAGRANWRREQIRMRTGPELSDFRVEIRHHCSIDLAEKVIDDEERLYNVLAHEYCHLTTFMISEIRNNPHGAEFKSWGSKVTRAFAHRGVEVTTKHSYKIDYKYIWECIDCSYEFKRHSKSIDIVRHSCGRCKGRLVQTKPVPRAGAVGKDGKREKSEYQVFVKANFARVKKEMEAKGLGTQMGKVMEAVAREYRANKASKSEEVVKVTVDEVEAALEDLKI